MFKIYNVDSSFWEYANKGSKAKYWTILNNEKALVKINKYKNEYEIRSWGVSEKIYSEIANYLGFSCVKIDFVKDEDSHYGIASYDYKIDNSRIKSGDDLYTNSPVKLPEKHEKRSIDKNYFYEDIKKILCYYDSSFYLLNQFNIMMIMDALTGEGDRHYENWGIYLKDSDYYLLPMYDNADCLLHQFREKEILNDKLKNQTLLQYSRNSISKIRYNNKKVKHIELLELLLKDSDEDIRLELKNNILKLRKLDDDYIISIINMIPEELCDETHKKYIIEYIIIRRDDILALVEEK